jgi:Spy/CpxP family protein refolding chaperone
MKKLNIAVIRIDGGTQARVALNSAQVTEYAEAMREGEVFPPVVVFHDGSDYWLADGFHRYHATKQLGFVSIDVEVKEGTVEEAQIYCFGANAKRGLSTNHEDNRSIITRMLEHPISGTWTNAEIARHVGVSKMTVGRVKASMEKAEEDTVKSFQRKDGKKVKVDTAKLATKAKEPAKEEKEEKEENEDHRIAELIDTINELNAENQKLKDIIAVGQWDASEIEKIDVQDTLNDLRQQIKHLEIDNNALRDSRDMFQNRNAELMKSVKALQAKLKKLSA